MDMSKEKVTSPCISVCKTDPISGFCYGCGRSNDEKKTWKDENTTNEWKLSNIEELRSRLNGWQLEAFNESYKSKQDSGLSLIKKKLLESRNN
jgi:Predicted Fe-S protein